MQIHIFQNVIRSEENSYLQAWEKLLTENWNEKKS